ncbi:MULTISPECIES: adenine phosphoribosyltransferase [Aedoeadaptatus]|uniref:Adenine phosphoribosyltransferase n=1 Tax=Aedoeadaptatus acetigenes TaxID=2981723 RepID=A0ABV1J615_9FIRM|nr:MULTISPECIES: adenine phosphoribosyltransferase [Peptoniphilaceae]MCU6786773.1 adenine phosphoribosyltransferase [Aedoeadaptatus acetigenes]
MDFKEKIRSIKDYPKEGITFRDITTLLKDGEAFREAIDAMKDLVKDEAIDKVVGIEARGFILGAPLAYDLGVGFVPIRKPGKLPADTHSAEYELEYGSDTVEMHVDAIEKGEKVLIVDDLLATGGTGSAAVEICKNAGADVIGCLVLIELDGLNGRDKMPVPVYSLMEFPA